MKPMLVATNKVEAEGQIRAELKRWVGGADDVDIEGLRDHATRWRILNFEELLADAKRVRAEAKIISPEKGRAALEATEVAALRAAFSRPETQLRDEL
jgi:hypothetical protein